MCCLALSVTIFNLFLLVENISGECRENWITYDRDHTTCFKVITRERKPWDGAREFCKEEGGELTSIKDTDMNLFIKNRLGLTNNEKYWIGAFFSESWQWSDSSDFGTFAQKRLAGGKVKSRKCVYLLNSKWRIASDDDCKGRKDPFI